MLKLLLINIIIGEAGSSSFGMGAGFTFSYYSVYSWYYSYYPEDYSFIKAVPKGINLSFSFKTRGIGLRVNPDFIKGGYRSKYESMWEYFRIQSDFKEIGLEVSILYYILSKNFDFYLGFGTLFSRTDYYLEDYYFGKWDSTVISEEMNSSGNLLGFPLIIGIEKEIFKNIRIFLEIYPLFYGLLNLKEERNYNGTETEKGKMDFLISGGFLPENFYSEGRLERIRIGLKYER